jgi:hypothetical protein
VFKRQYHAALCLSLVCLLPVNSFGFFDPTRPSDYEAPVQDDEDKKKTATKLQSVLISEKRRLAIINGQYYVVGDKVAGGVLISIEADGVKIRVKNNKILFLPLLESAVKQ